MIATSEEKYLEYFKKESVLLSPPKSDTNRKLRPSLFNSIHGIVGVKNYLDKIVNEQNQDGIIKQSRIAYAKEKLKEAKALLKKYPGNQHGEDARNKYSAKIKVYEMEARKCNHLIQQHQKEQAEKSAQRAVPDINKRMGKLSNGKLVEWAGREVCQNEDGADVFKDDKSFVDDFKKEQNELHDEKMARIHAEMDSSFLNKI